MIRRIVIVAIAGLVASIAYLMFPRSNEDEVSKLCGWAGEDLAKEQFDKVKGQFVPFVIWDAERNARAASRNQRAVLWDAVIRVYGKHLENNAQQIGDCVSFGMAHACEYLLAVQIVKGEDKPQSFARVYPPYIYGISRVQIGNARIPCNSDGSLGSWAAAGVLKYGVLPANSPNVPAYSGSIAKKWGCRPGPPEEFQSIGKRHLVEAAARVSTWQDVRDAIVNGYPVTIASNVGFQMRGSVRDGKLWLRQQGNWAHQMCVVGYDDKPEPCFCILNSWGPNAHGHNPDGPPGSFWVTASVMQRIVAQGDSFAISGQKGFEANHDWNIDILRREAANAGRDVRRVRASEFELALSG